MLQGVDSGFDPDCGIGRGCAVRFLCFSFYFVFQDRNFIFALIETKHN